MDVDGAAEDSSWRARQHHPRSFCSWLARASVDDIGAAQPPVGLLAVGQRNMRAILAAEAQEMTPRGWR
jgi:hypothetical protein